MCDPMIMGVASMVSGLANVMGEQSAQQKQQQAYDDWILMQRKNRTDQQAADEALRAKETAAQQAGLAQVSGNAQSKDQQTEADRLAAYYQGKGPASTESDPGADPGAPTAITDTHMLSGQSLNADDTFKTDLATKMTKASQDAQNRIKALAAVNSYGGSFGGLDTTTKLAFQNSGINQDYLNNLRKGNLAVYNVKQAVDPIHYEYQAGPTIG